MLSVVVTAAFVSCGLPAPVSTDAGQLDSAPMDVGLPDTAPMDVDQPDLAETGPTPAQIAWCRGDAALAEMVEAKTTALLSQLSLDEKIALMAGTFLDADGTWPVPGNERLGIPGLKTIDGPRGISKAAGAATAFPVAMMRGATFDPELERRVGEAIGVETRATGASVILAPTMNILQHPRWGRAQETYGEDTHHMGAMALAFVEGAQRQVMATAKHFAANSIENTRLEVDVTLDERTLREVYLPHFARVVKEGHVAAVMTAYNSVNGAFMSENEPLIAGVLRGEWGFYGYVMSDWLFGTHDTVRAARAGLDLEMPVAQIYGDALRTAIDAGQVDTSIVDEAVSRMLRARYCWKLDTDPPIKDTAKKETAEHRALAREVAERGIVLLTNANGALPLSRAGLGRIVVTGPLANIDNIGDLGSSAVEPSTVTNVLEGLEAYLGNDPAGVTHLPAPPKDATEEQLVRDADVAIVVVGLTSEYEGEAQIAFGDRASLDLPAGQREWIRTIAPLAKKTIVVLQGSGPFTIGDLVPDVAAILHSFYPGQEGGDAVARVLFGDVNPSGHLPVSFPASEADLPPFDNVSLKVDYGYLHGYRHLDHEKKTPLFPFGHGLSYTRYEYTNLRLDEDTLAADGTLRVTCDVQNSGARVGRATVQLYIGAPESPTLRAPRDLRGFAQVELAPGETKSVTIEVPIASLAIWDGSAMTVEATRYRVEVGASAGELPLVAEVTVAP